MTVRELDALLDLREQIVAWRREGGKLVAALDTFVKAHTNRPRTDCMLRVDEKLELYNARPRGGVSGGGE